MALQDDAQFLDAIPLRRLSGDVDLDGFDFLLGDGADVDEPIDNSTRSNSSDMIDALLCDQQEDPTTAPAFNNTNHQQNFNNSSFPGEHRRRRTKRERSASPTQQLRMSHNSFFGVPSSSRRQSMSHNDLSPYSSMTAGTNSSSPNAPTGIPKSQYTEALKSLAQSMKQTAESREYMVKMKREYLTPAQQAALASAKEQLQRQNEAVVDSLRAPQVQQQQQQQQVHWARRSAPSAFPSQLGEFLGQDWSNKVVNHLVFT